MKFSVENNEKLLEVVMVLLLFGYKGKEKERKEGRKEGRSKASKENKERETVL